jgi:hypothetical protein
MATKLNTFDFTESSKITSSEKAVYPWEEWFDGDIWQLTEGEDFHTHPLMMERIIRTRATGRKAKVTMRHIPLTINGKIRKNNPFGIIVMQRTDVVGPIAQEADEKVKAAKRAEAAQKRASKKASAAQEAEKFIKEKNLKPVNGTKVHGKKAISKRPVRSVKALAK